MCFNSIPPRVFEKDLVLRLLNSNYSRSFTIARQRLLQPSDSESLNWIRLIENVGATMTQRNPCDYCGQAFGSAEEREEHESDHLLTPEYRAWECDSCRRNFYSSLALEQHIHSKHSSCRFCAQRSSFEPSSLAPLDLMDPMQDDVHCGSCDKTFPSLLAFLQHDQAVHISCQYCDEIGSRNNSKSFDMHCCGCNEILNDDEALDKHIQKFPQHYHGHPQFIKKNWLFSMDDSSPPPSAAQQPQSHSQPTQPTQGLMGPPPRRLSRPNQPNPLPLAAAGIQFTRTPASPVDSRTPTTPPNPTPRPGITAPPAPSYTSNPPSNHHHPHPSFRHPKPASGYSTRPQPRSVPDPPLPQFVCDECRIVFPDAPTLFRHRSFSFLRSVGCDTHFECPFSLLRHIESGTCCHWMAPAAGQTGQGPGEQRTEAEAEAEAETEEGDVQMR